MVELKDDGRPGVRKMEGDIPDFVQFSSKTGEIYFSVPEGTKCVQFSLGFDEAKGEWKDEKTGKPICIVWWEIYKDKLPPQKRGMKCLKQVAFSPNNKQLKMYARGAEYYPDHCAFGFGYELPD